MDAGTLTILSRTLRLVLVVEDLCQSNKSLRADWDGRRMGVLKSIRDLATVKLGEWFCHTSVPLSLIHTNDIDSSMNSKPVSVCRELALTIAKSLPDSLLDHVSLSKVRVSWSLVTQNTCLTGCLRRRCTS